MPIVRCSEPIIDDIHRGDAIAMIAADQDEDLDLAVANAGQGSLSLLMNRLISRMSVLFWNLYIQPSTTTVLLSWVSC